MLLHSVDPDLTCNTQETASLERILIPATAALPARPSARPVIRHLTPCAPLSGLLFPTRAGRFGQGSGHVGQGPGQAGAPEEVVQVGRDDRVALDLPQEGAGGRVAQADGGHLLADARADARLQVVQHRPDPHLHRTALVHHQLPDLDAAAGRSSACAIGCFFGCHNDCRHLCNVECGLVRPRRRRQCVLLSQSDKIALHCRCFCVDERCQCGMYANRVNFASGKF